MCWSTAISKCWFEHTFLIVTSIKIFRCHAISPHINVHVKGYLGLLHDDYGPHSSNGLNLIWAKTPLNPWTGSASCVQTRPGYVFGYMIFTMYYLLQIVLAFSSYFEFVQCKMWENVWASHINPPSDIQKLEWCVYCAPPNYHSQWYGNLLVHNYSTNFASAVQWGCSVILFMACLVSMCVIHACVRKSL